jgi:hypothetical protein
MQADSSQDGRTSMWRVRYSRSPFGLRVGVNRTVSERGKARSSKTDGNYERGQNQGDTLHYVHYVLPHYRGKLHSACPCVPIWRAAPPSTMMIVPDPSKQSEQN